MYLLQKKPQYFCAHWMKKAIDEDGNAVSHTKTSIEIQTVTDTGEHKNSVYNFDCACLVVLER